jgi:predicted nucleic acid-binding protein
MAVIDTSAYVSWAIATDANHYAAQAWIGQALRRRESIAAPWILAAEVASAVTRNTGDITLAVQVVHTLTSAGLVHLVPVGPVLAQQAAMIAAQFRIRGCDAIFVALAASTGETLVTFDKQQATRAAAVVAVHQPN